MPPFSPHKEEAPVLAPSDELAALLRASNKMHSSFLSDSQSVDQRIHGDDCGHDHVHAVNPTPKKPLPNEDILREALQCVACNQLVDVCCSLQCGCLMYLDYFFSTRIPTSSLSQVSKMCSDSEKIKRAE